MAPVALCHTDGGRGLDEVRDCGGPEEHAQGAPGHRRGHMPAPPPPRAIVEGHEAERRHARDDRDPPAERRPFHTDDRVVAELCVGLDGDDRDLALRVRLVALVPRRRLDDATPPDSTLLTLEAPRPGPGGARTDPDADLGVALRVQVPGRVPVVPGVRRHDQDVVAVGDEGQGDGVRLPGATPRGRQQQHRLGPSPGEHPASREQVDAALQHDESPENPVAGRPVICPTHGWLPHVGEGWDRLCDEPERRRRHRPAGLVRSREPTTSCAAASRRTTVEAGCRR